MLENIANIITRLAMDVTCLIASHHVPNISAKMRLSWQRPLPSNGALDISSYGHLEAERVNQF